MPATPLGSGTVPGSATARIRAALALALTPATVAPFVALAGIAVVAIVLRFYALEGRGRGFLLAFSAACLASAAYGFLQGAW